MGHFCACIITTPPQIMRPKRVLPIHTKSITQPLHTVHTGHVSATFFFSVSTYCARQADRAVSTLLAIEQRWLSHSGITPRTLSCIVMKTAPKAPPQIIHRSPDHSAKRHQEPQVTMRCAGVDRVAGL